MVTESKKYHPSKFARLVIYPAGVFVFLMILGFVLLLANGYQVTFKDSRLSLTKTGMIIVSSRPSEAEIYVDNKKVGKRTGFSFFPVKLQNVSVGEHVIRLTKNGYRDWEKKTTVKSSLVSWLNYVLLFPKDLGIRNIDELAGKKVLAQSKSKRYLLLEQVVDSKENYFVFDETNTSLTKIWPKNYTPTEAWLRDPKVLEAAFNSNNNKLYLKVQNGTGIDNVLLDVSQNGKITSLSQTYKFEFSKVVWNPVDSNQLFVQSKKDLYRIDTNQLSPAQLVASAVVDFAAERNREFYYVSNEKDDYSLLQLGFEGGQKQTIAKVVPKDTSYKISYSQEADAVAVLARTEKSLVAYYRINNQLSSLQLASGVDDYKWSSNFEKIAYWNQAELKSFDWEKETETLVKIPEKIISVDWYYDDAHFLTNTKKGIFEMDFDGANRVVFSSQPTSQINLNNKSASFIFQNNENTSTYSRYISEL